MDNTDEIEGSLSQIAEASIGRSDVDQILEAFGRRVGADWLRLDEAGVAWLTLRDRIDVCLFHLDHFPGIVLAARLPTEVRENAVMLRSLLQANMSWERTQGGSFGLVPPTDEPMLCRMIPLVDADAEFLDRHMAAFADFVQQWHDEIRDGLDHETGDDADDKASAESRAPQSHTIIYG